MRKTRPDGAIAKKFAKVRNETPRTLFEAGSGGTRRTFGWTAPTTSPNVGTLESLIRLRDRSRLATRNDGYAKGVIDKLVTNIIGTGIKPLSQGPSEEFRAAVHAAWVEWVCNSDADGRLDFYGQESQAVRCWLEAGEVFLRLRPRLPQDGLTVPLQIQVLEPELCPHLYNTKTPSGNNVRAGIEFDQIGRRVAYYFYFARVGELYDWNPADLRRVPAEQILHVYKPVRAGQLRGIPHLTQALIRLRELDKFDDATVTRQQLANMFVAFLEHPTGDATTGLVPIFNTTSPSTQDGRPTLGLQPGTFQELDAGEKVTFSDPPDVIGGYEGFIKQQLRSVSAATGVPYEVLTGDMSSVNDRTVRVILHEFRRGIMAEQHQTVVFSMCWPIFYAFLDYAFAAGALAMPGYLKDPRPYQAAKWMPQGWPYIHPVQDIEATQKAIRSGLTSRSEEVAEQGEDSEVIDAQNAADNARADALKLKYDSDGRVPLTGGGAGPAAGDKGGAPSGGGAPDGGE